MKRLMATTAAALLMAGAAAQADLTPVAGLEIESYKQLTQDISGFLMAAGNPGMGMMVSPMIGGLLCAPNMQGVDLEKPIRGLVLMPEVFGEQPRLALILPMAGDGSAYLASVRSAFEQSSKNGTVHQFQQPNPMMQLKWQKAFVKLMDGQAIVATDAETVTTVEAQLRTRALPTYPKVSGTVRLALDLVKLTPILENVFEQTHDMMAKHMPPPEEGAMDPVAVSQSNNRLTLALLKQLRAYSLGLGGGQEGLTLYSRLDVLPDTAAAQVLGTLKPPSAEMKSAMPPNTLLSLVGSGMDSYDIWGGPYADHMATMYKSMGAEMAPMGPFMRQVMREAKGLYGSEYAIGLLPAADGAGVTFFEVVQLTGDRDVTAYMQKTMAAAQEIYAKAMPGVTVATQAAAPVDGIPVHGLKYDFSGIGPEAKMAMGPWAGMMSAFEGEYAVVDKTLLFTMGKAGTIAPLIRHIKSGAVSTLVDDQTRRVFPKLKGTPVAMFHLSLVEIVRNLMSKGDNALPPELLAMLPKNSAGIGSVQLTTPTALFTALRITGSEANALMKVGPVAGKAVQQMFESTIRQQMDAAVIEMELEDAPVPPPMHEDMLPEE